MCVVPGPASQVAVMKRIYALPGLQCRGSPMGVPNVAGESAVYYPHHEGVLLIALKRLHDAEC